MWRLVAFLVLAAAGALAWAVWSGRLAVPDEYNPYAPLDLRAEKNFLTGWKFRRALNEPALCRAVLDGADLLAMSAVPDRTGERGCGWSDALRIRAGDELAFSSSFIATCPLALALAAFTHEALQEAAERHLGSRVARIEHVGSYACRDVAGREGRRSEHAAANALDITAFVLEDGTRISVERDWTRDGPRAAFLRDARDSACHFFKVVLSPDYNAAHRTHFHLDMGRFSICR